MPKEKEIKLFGKQRELKRISDMFLSGRMPHGIMLTGAAGLGKRTLARYLAMLMMCENPDGDAPCGECISCRKILLGEHPDVIYAKGEKYTADRVRDCVKQASYYPNDGNLRIFLYENCDEMNDVQQNILLKSIEEPSPYNRYIFTCENTSVILQTILSRLVCIPMSDMCAEDCRECLIYCGISAENADSALSRLGTNPGRIMRIISDEKQIKIYDSADRIIRALAALSEYDSAKEFASFSDREDLFSLAAVLYEKVSEAAMPKQSADEAVRMLREKLALKRLYRLSEKLSEFLLLDGTNINVKLIQASWNAQLFEILL